MNKEYKENVQDECSGAAGAVSFLARLFTKVSAIFTLLILSVISGYFISYYIPALEYHFEPGKHTDVMLNYLNMLLFSFIMAVCTSIVFSTKLFPRLKLLWRVIILLFIFFLTFNIWTFINNWTPPDDVSLLVSQNLFYVVFFILCSAVLILKTILTDKKYKRLLEDFQKRHEEETE
jgi:hypothetical protein